MSVPDPVVPVVVVGAGPTGVLAATLLGRQGVECLLLDRAHGPAVQPRAVHLDDEVRRVLARVGLEEGFAAVSRPALGLRLLDRQHRVLAEFARSPEPGVHGHPQASMFDQPDLEVLLRGALDATPAVVLREGVEVTGLQQDAGGVRVRTRDVATGAAGRVRARYVLGCDGAHSPVRSAVGARMRDLGLSQRWLVVDVATDADLGQWEGVHQVCDTARAATYMRVGERRHRWEFRLLDGERAEDLGRPERLLPLLAPWTRGLEADRLQVLRRAEYVFRAQVADRWRVGRVLLLGDAAHLTPPFVGQGLGAGLRDADGLAWKLAGVLRGELGEQALDSYQAEREPHARALIRLAGTVGRLMTDGGRAGDGLRRALAPRLHLVPGLRARVLDSATPRLSRSSLVLRGLGAGPLPGRLCPGAPLPDGRRPDDVAAGRFLVVSRVPVAEQAVAEVQHRGAVLLHVRDQEPLGRWLAAGRAAAVAVRPDGVVLAAARAGVEGLLEHLPVFRPPSAAAAGPVAG